MADLKPTIPIGATLSNNVSGGPIAYAKDIWNNEDNKIEDIFATKEALNAKQDVISDLSEMRVNIQAALDKAETDPSVPAWAKTTNKPSYTLDEVTDGVTRSLSNFLEKTDIASWAKASTKPTYTAAEVGALANTVTIPSKTSQLTNDSGFLTSHQSLAGYATEGWVNNQGYLKVGEGGEYELTGYLKKTDFLTNYSEVVSSVNSYSNASVSGTFNAYIGYKRLTFTGTPIVTVNNSSATVAVASDGYSFTKTGDVRNANNTLTVLVSGVIDGANVSYSKTIKAYYNPIKMGFLSASNKSASTLTNVYFTDINSVEVPLTNTTEGYCLYVYIPKAYYTDANLATKGVTVVDSNSPINVWKLTKISEDSDYVAYTFNSPQKTGYTYNFKFI